MNTVTDIDQMPVVMRRRIEAMVLGLMIRAFAEQMGKEKAYAIARRVITQIAQEQAGSWRNAPEGRG